MPDSIDSAFDAAEAVAIAERLESRYSEQHSIAVIEMDRASTNFYAGRAVRFQKGHGEMCYWDDAEA